MNLGETDWSPLLKQEYADPVDGHWIVVDDCVNGNQKLHRQSIQDHGDQTKNWYRIDDRQELMHEDVGPQCVSSPVVNNPVVSSQNDDPVDCGSQNDDPVDCGRNQDV